MEERKKNDLNALLYTDIDSEDEIKTFHHSPYYDWEGLLDILVTIQDSITVLSLNCQSIRAKFDKLKCLLDFLKSKQCQFTAICLQETWLSEDDVIPQGKYCSQHGGLFIYVRQGYNATLREVKKSKTYEGLFIEVEHENLPKKLIIANIYRPPKQNNRNSDIELFLKELRPV